MRMTKALALTSDSKMRSSGWGKRWLSLSFSLAAMMGISGCSKEYLALIEAVGVEIAPWLEIDDESLSTVISSGFNEFKLSGTCSEKGLLVRITSPVVAETACTTDGIWSFSLDLSGLPDGTYSFRFQHDSSAGTVIEGISKDFVKISRAPDAIQLPDLPGGYNNSGTFHLSWVPGVDSAGTPLVKYQYAIGTSPGGTDITGWADLVGNGSSDIVVPTTFLDSQNFFVSIRGVDIAGNTGAPVVSDPVAVDTIAPVLGTLSASASVSPSLTTSPTFSWSAIQDNTGGSGLKEYQYAVGLAPGDYSLRTWTSLGLTTAISATGLTLAAGQGYTLSVRAADDAGNPSNIETGSWSIPAAPSGGGGGGGTPPPSLTGVTPSAAPRLSTSSLALSGSNFTAGATVKLGSVDCAAVNVVSSNQITCTAPTSQTAGVVAVEVTNPDGAKSTLQSGFRYLTAPTIASISPAGGPTTGGFAITITGTDLAATTQNGSVSIGGANCTITAASSTSITCTAPPQSSGTYDLVISNPDTQSVSRTQAINYGPAPVLSSISPTSGLLAGGFPLTVTGVNFTVTSQGGSILVGGSPCPLTGTPSATTLTCSAPAKAAGSYDIRVTNADLQHSTLANALTYATGSSAGPAPVIATVTPGTGSRLTTTSITLSGSNFQSGATASIGNLPCGSPSVAAGGNSMTCIAPVANISGPYTVTVVNPDLGMGSRTNAFTYLSSPSITGLTPAGGPPEGGFPITIQGADLQASTSSGTILIGGAPCEITANTTTAITCTAPPMDAGTYSLTLTNPDGMSSTRSNAVNYGPAPGITAVSPASGHINGGFTLLISGSNFKLTASQGQVKVGGANCPITGTPTEESLSCVAPARSGGSHDLVVINPDGQTATLAASVLYQAVIPLTITGVTPASGSRLSATPLTVTGTGFLSGASVTVGALTCASVNVASATSLTCTAPAANTSGAMNVSVSQSGGALATRTNGFTYLSAPGISSLSPSGGPVSGGFPVTLTGSDLMATPDLGSILIGGFPCTITASSSTSTTCLAPSLATGTYSAVITNPDGQSATRPSAITYGPGPEIATVMPTTGNIAGGFTVSITGLQLKVTATDGNIRIGGSPCLITGTPSLSAITCTAPAKSAGQHDLIITNPDGQTATLAGAITYLNGDPLHLTSVSPASGSRLSSTQITLTGTGFQNGATVQIGSQTCAAVNVLSSTSLSCTAPTYMGIGSADVTITNPDQQEAVKASGYTYLSAPGISAVTPNHGKPSGGFEIAVTGSDLFATETVGTLSVGGANCPILSSSPTEVRCTTPARTAGSYAVVISNPDGQSSTLAGGLRYDPAPTLSSVSPGSGYLVGGTVVTLTGTGFLSGASVKIGSRDCVGVSVTSTTSASCTTPEGSSLGTTSVTFTNEDTQSAVSANAFTYTETASNSAASTLTSSAPIAPIGPNASIALVAIPKNTDGSMVGSGKTIEVTSSAAVTWSGGSACRTPASACQRMTDNGNGSYSVRAGVASGGAANITFTARSGESGGDVVFTQTASTNFDNSNFNAPHGRTITAAGTITAADNGLNIYINLTTATDAVEFQAQNLGLGHVFAGSGRMTHPVQTTTATARLYIKPASFHLGAAAKVDVKALGCQSSTNKAVNLSTGEGCGAQAYGSSGASTTTYVGGSHGGAAGANSTSIVGDTYGNLRDPSLPGMGSASSVTTFNGGGVFRIITSGACALTGASSIDAGAVTSGAGGSISMNCGAIDATGFTGTVSANGGASTSTSYSSGGGGRIALVTSGGGTSWTGLPFPNSSATVTALITKVQARGGAHSAATNRGGAGTIYIKHAGTPNGALLVANDGIDGSAANAGKTRLIGISGTLQSTPTPGSQLASVNYDSAPAIGTSFVNAYAGQKVRLDITYDGGVQGNWSDDNLLTIQANDATTITTTQPISNTAAGKRFRSIEVFDYLEITQGTSVLTNSDIYVTSGSLSNPTNPSATVLNGVIAGLTGAKTHSAAKGISFELQGTQTYNFSGSTLSGKNLTSSITGTLTTDSLDFSTGNITLSGSSITTLTGSISASIVTVSGTATLTSPAGITTEKYEQQGGTVSAIGGITLSGSSTNSLSGGALTTNSITGNNFTVSGGTLTHETSTSVVKRLEITLSGGFTLSGTGLIDAKGIGAPGQNIPDLEGGTGYISSIGSNWYNGSPDYYCGGSHGGMGGGNTTYCRVSPTYDDFRNPNLPGAGGGYTVSNTGGGVVRIRANGGCRLSGSGSIDASAPQSRSAGGSILLNCAAIDATGYTGTIKANGATGGTSGGGPTYPGGGGRIALITSGPSSAWTGALSIPSTSVQTEAFTNIVQARGGTGTNGTAGAGTIFLKHSGMPNGALLIANGGAAASSSTDGSTLINGFSGLLTSTAAGGSRTVNINVQSTSGPSLAVGIPAGIVNAFRGTKIRLDTSYSNGTPHDWTDDSIVTISSHTATAITTVESLPSSLADTGDTFRTIEVLDYLDVLQGGNILSNSDIYLTNGSLSSSSGSDSLLMKGFIASYTNNAGFKAPMGKYFDFELAGTAGYTIGAGTLLGRNLTISTSGTVLAGNINLGSGTLTLNGSGALTLTGGVTAGPVVVSSGTMTAPTGITASSYQQTGGTVSANAGITLTSGGSATLAAGSLTTNAITGQNLTLSGGTLSHELNTTSIKRLNISLAGNFVLSGSASIDAKGLGSPGLNIPNYATGNSYTTTGAATGYNSSSDYFCGGSHGGLGAANTTYCQSGPTYDDFRNPNLPGGGGGYSLNSNGGGVVRISVSGSCRLADTSTIDASGRSDQYRGAGGTVYLKCASLDSSGFTGSIKANGCPGASGSSGPSYPGGGGRIALITTGNSTSWTGALPFPSNKSSVDSFLAKVQARSGTSNVGYAGAGTIYIKHGSTPNGALLISNGGQSTINDTDGKTVLLGLSGTLSSTPASGGKVANLSVASTPGVPTGMSNLYKGMKIRLNTGYSAGTPLDWSDDALLGIDTHTTTSLNTVEVIPDSVAVQGNNFRTLEVLDYLEVAEGTTVQSNSDIYVTTGSLSAQGAADSLTLNGVLAPYSGGAATLVNGKFIDFDLNGGHGFNVGTAAISGRHLAISTTGTTFPIKSGAWNFASGNITLSSSNAVTISGGISAGTLSLTNSTLTSTLGASIVSYSQTGGSVVLSSGITASSAVSIGGSGASLVTNAITAASLSISAGVIKHEPQSTSSTLTKRLNINLTGNFSISGSAKLDASGLGTPPYNFPNINTGEGYSTTLASTVVSTSYCGGSHGGLGAGPSATCAVSPTYGDFRNPNLPGASGPYTNYTGGGVIRVTAGGICSFANTSQVLADANLATYGGAGGSIYINCGSMNSTGHTGFIRANGASGTSTSYAGGGGRIALITTGDAASWAGNIKIPTTPSELAAVTTAVKAEGGAGTGSGAAASANAGAGTIFLKHSGLPYGALLISNGAKTSAGTNDGKTVLIGLSGTLAATPGAGARDALITPLSQPGVPTGFTNAYKGMKVRLNTLHTNGTSGDWTDDQVNSIVSHTSSSVTVGNAIVNATQGDTFRTIEVLDHLEITAGTGVATNSDIFVRNGSLSNQGAADSVTLNGIISSNSNNAAVAALNKFIDYDLSGSSSFNLGSGPIAARKLSFTSTGSITAGTLDLGSGNLTLNGSGTLTLSGGVTAGNVSLTTGTLSTSSIAADQITLNSGNLTTNSITGQNLTVLGGTIKHEPQVPNITKRLEITLSGNFSISGTASIDTTGLGVPIYNFPNLVTGEGYATTNASTVSGRYCGGSHSGLGAGPTANCTVAPAYDNFRDPRLPGASGPYTNYIGGGVIRISAVGNCTLANSASLIADGRQANYGGAGGSIYMNCGNYISTGYTGTIRANGAPGTSTSYAGGGGMVALVSTGTSTQWSGAIRIPSNSTQVASLLTYAQAFGGSVSGSGGASTAPGGAGTLYLQAADVPNGALLVANNNKNTGDANSGRTFLRGIAGTIAYSPGSNDTTVKVNVATSGQFNSSWNNHYAGQKIRLNTGYTSGSGTPWNGDIYNLTGNSVAGGENFLSVDRAISNVAAGNSFRTLEVLDYLEIGAGVSIVSNSDIFVTQGSLSDPGNPSSIKLYGVLTTAPGANAIFAQAGGKTFEYELTGAYGYPSNLQGLNAQALTVNLTTGSSIGLASLDLGSSGDLVVQSGTLNVTGSTIARSLVVGGAGFSAGSLNLSSGDLRSSGAAALSIPVITMGGGDITLGSSGTHTLGKITGARHFTLSAGTLQHGTQGTTPTAGIKTLDLSLTGDLNLSGGAINLNGRGFTGGFTPWYKYDVNPALAELGARQNTTASLQGGSHGGKGGGVNTTSTVFDTYDDYRWPVLPGSGSLTKANASGTGGGAIKVHAPSGACNFSTATSNITANATGNGGAGGSILLNCGSITAANTISLASAFLQANGSAAMQTSTTLGRGGGGGGRIALLSAGNATSFGNILPYPNTNATLTTFKSLVKANGGAGTANFHSGAAGSIYIKNSGSTHGDLIIDNGTVIAAASSGKTELISSTAGANVILSETNSTEVALTSGQTPFANRNGTFTNHLLHFFTLDGANFNPSSNGRTEVLIGNNGSNSLLAATFHNFTGAAGKTYRVVYKLDSLEVGGNAQVDFAGSDLILSNCDIHSNDGATFDVPSGSLISGINSMASSTCSVPATQRLGGATPRVSYSAAAPAPAANGYFFQ